MLWKMEHFFSCTKENQTQTHCKDNADISSGAKGQNFNLSLHLQLYSLYVRSECSGESVHLHTCLNLVCIRGRSEVTN